jgi:hypothetical protein
MTTTSIIQPWNEFVIDALKQGFEIISCRRYNSRNGNTITSPAFLVAAHRAKNLLIIASSIIWERGEEKVGSVSLYGCVAVSDDLVFLEGVTSSGRYGEKMYFIIQASHDVFYRIERVIEQGKLCSWKDVPMRPYMLDYEQRDTLKGEPLANHRLWEEFLTAAPAWVRDIIV